MKPWVGSIPSRADTRVLCPLLLSATLIGNPVQAGDATRVLERGPHHKVVETVLQTVDPSGQARPSTQTYTVLATGMHYWDAAQEAWLESSSEVEILEGRAVARRGQIRAEFQANLNTVGSIRMEGPDGRVFLSHPLGLAYFDAVTGESVLVAGLRDSQGQVLEGGVVYYQDVLDGPLVADIRYQYTRHGFEQDLILVTAPPPPEAYGLDPRGARLVMVTEFVQAPEPAIRSETIKRQADEQVRALMAEPDLIDEVLDFGGIKMGTGFAFATGQAVEDAPVLTGKSWRVIDGRRMLLEQVDYEEARPWIEGLPQAQARGPVDPAKRARNLAGIVPGMPNGEVRSWREGLLARAQIERPGYVLDYIAVVGTQSNLVLRGNTTYFVDGTVQLYGTTTVMGGAVVKYNQGGTTNQLVLNGPVDCRTSPWHPAIFTGKDDGTVGAVITANALSGYYAQIALYCKDTTVPYNWHNIRVRHAKYPFWTFVNVTLNLENAQIGHCERGQYSVSSKPSISRNVLFHDLDYGFYGANTSTNHVEHATLHRVGSLTLNTTMPPVRLTNSLLIGVTNNPTHYTGSQVASSLDDAGIFSTVGAGSRYLPADSPYVGAGTTNINTGLLRNLRQRTTQAPEILSGSVTVDTVLEPRVRRSTGYPSLGYHYDPIDYAVSGLWVTNATLMLTNGVALATFGQHGLWIDDHGQLISQGRPDRPNVLTRFYTAQEVATNWGGGEVGTTLTISPYNNQVEPPTVRLRFSRSSIPADGGYHLYTEAGEDPSDWRLGKLELKDSTLLGGAIGLSDTGAAVVGWTNTVAEALSVTVGGDAQFGAFNNLYAYVGGVLDQDGATHQWLFKDNLLDKATLTNATSALAHEYNAFWQSTNFYSIHATHGTEMVLSSLAYQTGPLGGYYQPLGSVLIDAGSLTNAALAGLYHFTTTTNQVKEGFGHLDVGPHFVAVDSNTGLPLDEDGDGWPDYFEDFNGNGVADGAETDWEVYDTALGVGAGPGLRVFTPLR